MAQRSLATGLVLLLLLSTSGLALSTASATGARSNVCAGPICINELIPNPAGYDNATYPGGEWVELLNEGSTSVDVRGWSVVNEGGKSLDFDASSIVDYDAADSASYTMAPGDYLVVARNGASDFYLANSGARSLDLRNTQGFSQHLVTWSGSTSGDSYERDATTPTNDLVATDTPTPGQANNETPTLEIVPGPFHITEVMPNPWPSADNATWPGGEWVEIYNPGSSDVDLTDWVVVDAALNQLKLDGDSTYLVDGTTITTLPAGTRAIVALNGTSMLNNGVEQLDLLWPNETRAQRLAWTSADPGFGLQQILNTSWGIAAYPTPFEAEPDHIPNLTRLASDVRFDEILPVAAVEGGAVGDTEWIELHNAGPMAVDVAGWTVRGGLDNVTTVSAANLVHDGTGTVLGADARALLHMTGEHRLWNFTDVIRLIDGSGALVDTAHWVSAPTMDVSLVRDNDPTSPWVPTATPTPGTNGSAPEDAAVLRFSELMPDPVGDNGAAWPSGAWIEIINHDTQTVDLAGWGLVAPGRNMTIEAAHLPLASSTSLAPGEVALVALASDLLLDGSSEDLVALVTPDGRAVEEVGWLSVPEGESLILANSSHAGAGPDGLNRGVGPGWDLSAWPTPGELNPVWPEWTEGHVLRMMEIMPDCADGTPGGTWIEVMNVGSSDVNASRWRLVDAEGRSWFVRADTWWTPNATGLVLAPGERGLILVENQDDVLGTVVLHDPDAATSSTADLSDASVTACRSFIDLLTPTLSAWATPGQPEPEDTAMAGPEDLTFTALMPAGSLDDTNVEFVEIRNAGDKPAVLDGWILERVTSATNAFQATITDLRIEPGSSVTLSADATGLTDLWDGDVVNMTDHLSAAVFLNDGGGAVRLLTPTGAIADVVVWGDGPVDVQGWSGVSVVPPLTGLDHLVYLRGDGCGQSTDTDTAEDWKLRWTRLGAATPCVNGMITDLTNMRPLIAPEAGLLDLVRWIDGANTSLEVQVYQIHEPNLVHALIRAAQRGVAVRVIMDAGDSWWSSSDMRAIDGVASSLTDAGADVLLLGAEDDDPYAFMHAKLAVRDGNEVWIGSGNWKSSSTPKPGDAGNRDWGLLVHSPELADTLGELLAMDRDVASVYVRPANAGAPNGWTLDAAQSLSGTEAEAVVGTANGEVLTCPDDCILGLVGMLDNAQSEALLSLQYLEMDWTWGWGENPLLAAMHDAAERGVRLRVALNGAYLDDDMQSVVDLLNEDWNATQGHDVAAVIMSPGDNVTKLHNKGAIIDGTSVLISSINWGDSSMLRNREVGLLVHHAPLASVFHASWSEDWNRVDDSTDSDNDGLLDAWELEHGLNRARRTAGGTVIEADLDPDGDGLTHLEEFNLGSNPNSNDTDGDCILDDLEVLRAEADPSGPSAADRISMADADGDGTADHLAEGCTSTGAVVDDGDGDTTTDDEQNVTSPDDDVDLDGVPFGEDRCPATPQGDPVDADGCSADQRRLLLSDGEQEEDGFGWFLPVVGIVGLLVVLTGAMGLRKNDDEPNLDASMPVEVAAAKPLVVLDGRPSDADLRARLTGWDDAVIEERLSEGWTLEGLVEYYEKQA